MKKPSRRQIIARRRALVAISFALIFGMGAVTQRALYKSKYQAPPIALAQNKQVEEGYEIQEVKEYMISPSVDNMAYVPQRAYDMYSKYGVRTIDVNGDDLFIGLDKDIPLGVKVQQTEISGNRVRVIIRD